jgi:Ala-tRNA(Pro) deacylase
MPASPEDLFAYLEELGIETTTVTHPPLHTVEESKALRGDLSGAHIKNLFLKDKKGRLFLLTCLENRTVNMKTLDKAIGSARLSFGKPDLLWETLGVRPGAVTPFTLINDRETEKKVTFALDAALQESDVIHAHPLHNEATTAISSEGLMKFIAACGHTATIVDFDAQD